MVFTIEYDVVPVKIPVNWREPPWPTHCWINCVGSWFTQKPSHGQVSGHGCAFAGAALSTIARGAATWTKTSQFSGDFLRPSTMAKKWDAMYSVSSLFSRSLWDECIVVLYLMSSMSFLESLPAFYGPQAVRALSNRPLQVAGRFQPVDLPLSYGGFQLAMGVPQNEWLISWKTLLQWSTMDDNWGTSMT